MECCSALRGNPLLICAGTGINVKTICSLEKQGTWARVLWGSASTHPNRQDESLLFIMTTSPQ